MGMRDRLAVLDRALVAGRRPAPKAALTAPPVVRVPVAAPTAPVAAPPTPVVVVPELVPVAVAPPRPAPVALAPAPVPTPPAAVVRAPISAPPTPAPIVVTFEPAHVTAAPRAKVRREPLRPLHRANRALAALWWFFADGVLLGLAALLRGLRPVRTMAVGAPVACVLVGIGISLWWGSWAYAVIGALAAVCFVWIGRSEESPGS